MFLADRQVNGEAVMAPVKVMRKMVRALGPEIIQAVEPNSQHEVLSGQFINLIQYTRTIKELHGGIALSSRVLQNFQILRSFCNGRHNNNRACNVFDNVTMLLRNFLQPHPKNAVGGYPLGTAIGNNASHRQSYYVNEKPER